MSEVKVYHFLSDENWPSVRRDGLIPYPAFNSNLEGALKPGDKAIWAWPQLPTGHFLTGQVLMTCMRAHCWSVRCVSFTIDTSETYPCVVHHDGHLAVGRKEVDESADRGDWVYHHHELAYLLQVPIAPERLRVEATWSLDEYVNFETRWDRSMILSLHDFD